MKTKDLFFATVGNAESRKGVGDGIDFVDRLGSFISV